MSDKFVQELRDHASYLEDDLGSGKTCSLLRKAASKIEKLMNDDRWIDCDDYLPEDGESVLVWYEYYRYGVYNRMYRTYGVGYQYNGVWSLSGMRARCIAWQPLPKRYRRKRK